MATPMLKARAALRIIDRMDKLTKEGRVAGPSQQSEAAPLSSSEQQVSPNRELGRPPSHTAVDIPELATIDSAQVRTTQQQIRCICALLHQCVVQCRVYNTLGQQAAISQSVAICCRPYCKTPMHAAPQHCIPKAPLISPSPAMRTERVASIVASPAKLSCFCVRCLRPLHCISNLHNDLCTASRQCRSSQLCSCMSSSAAAVLARSGILILPLHVCSLDVRGIADNDSCHSL